VSVIITPGKTLFGASQEGGDPTAFEKSLGTNLSLFRSYFTASKPVSSFVARAKDDLAHNRLPLMSTKLPSTWTNFAAGKDDVWFNGLTKALNALGGPVWLSLHHEPRGEVGSSGSAQDWIKMLARAKKLTDATAPNVKIVGIMNGISLEKATEYNTYKCTPATGPHYMGYDHYNQWAPPSTGKWKTVDQVFGIGKVLQGWGFANPVVGEWGVRADPKTKNKAGTWITDAFAYLTTNKYAAASYFNSGANSPDGPWTLSGETLAAFKAALVKSKV
jgi:hypothetical protein